MNEVINIRFCGLDKIKDRHVRAATFVQGLRMSRFQAKNKGRLGTHLKLHFCVRFYFNVFYIHVKNTVPSPPKLI